MKTKQPVILIIRDGWGYNPSKKDNPISKAKTPYEDFSYGVFLLLNFIGCTCRTH